MEKPVLPPEILDKLPNEMHRYIAYLKAQLAQNSHNSSKPPSSNPPDAPPRPPKNPTGRKRAGQKGYVRYERKLVAPEEVD